MHKNIIDPGSVNFPAPAKPKDQTYRILEHNSSKVPGDAKFELTLVSRDGCFVDDVPSAVVAQTSAGCDVAASDLEEKRDFSD